MVSIGFAETAFLFLMLALALCLPAALMVFLMRGAVRKQTEEMRAAVEQSSARQLELVRGELKALCGQIKAEAATAASEVAAAVPAQPEPVSAPQKITEDQLMILGAVLACHFGKRVKIRSARVITVGSGSNVWSQQGRAAVQASHAGLY